MPGAGRRGRTQSAAPRVEEPPAFRGKRGRGVGLDGGSLRLRGVVRPNAKRHGRQPAGKIAREVQDAEAHVQRLVHVAGPPRARVAPDAHLDPVDRGPPGNRRHPRKLRFAIARGRIRARGRALARRAFGPCEGRGRPPPPANADRQLPTRPLLHPRAPRPGRTTESFVPHRRKSEHWSLMDAAKAQRRRETMRVVSQMDPTPSALGARSAPESASRIPGQFSVPHLGEGTENCPIPGLLLDSFSSTFEMSVRESRTLI